MSSVHTASMPNTPEDRVAPAYSQAPRKMASTGGGRAWSEEEENYLIETRQHKMPYKHIAAHLNKTELACRLHYHQLSFGTKRRQGRRRTSSVSSARSSASAHSYENNSSLLAHQRPLPQLSPPASPRHRGISSRSQSPPSFPHSHYAHPSHLPPSHLNGSSVPILPKPVCSTSAAPSHSAFAPNQGLRLITSDLERHDERPRVDKARLARIYDAHRAQFWGAVARDYGDTLPPTVLESYWWRSAASAAAGSNAVAGHFPPTPPNRSPQMTEKALPAHQKPAEGGPLAPFRPATAFHHPPPHHPTPPASSFGTETRNTFAISSLLTEDKEVGTTQAPQLPSVAAH